MPGGFIGVDVFFVISGYLITAILAREVDQGSFSFAGFYERRIRRIWPALFVMLLLVSCLAIYLLLPQDLVSYASSLRAAVFSYSNLYFWSIGTYFASNYTWLLLHTWSLSVEEQFYIFFPILFVVLKRSPRACQPVLWCVFAASLSYSSWLTFHNPNAAFYNPFSRIWELLVGCLLALMKTRSEERGTLDQALAWAGLAMIVSSIFLYSKLTYFPGVSALLPCVGAALLLATGREGKTTVSRLLAWKPLAWVGTISYSLYLWHWPVMLASRFQVFPMLKPYGLMGKVTLLSLSMLLGYLSWRFVEQPFRSKAGPSAKRKWVFVFGAAGACSVLLMSGLLNAKHGFPRRFSPRALEIASWLSKPQELTEHNIIAVKQGLTSWSSEDQAKMDVNKPNYLLIGDSHAAALRPGLVDQLQGVNIQMAVQANCEPLLDASGSSACNEMNRQLFQKLLPTHSFDAVLLTHRWLNAGEVEQLEPTVAWFKQHQIPLILIGPVQEYRASLPLLLAYSIRLDRPRLAEDNRDTRYADLDKLLARKAASWQVPYISLLQTFCPKVTCKEFVDVQQLVPTLYDGGHLTYPAANWAVKQWIDEGFLPVRRQDLRTAKVIDGETAGLTKHSEPR